MGHTCHASVFVGYKIPADVIYDAYLNHGQERGCTHPESPSKFCGECGAPMWREIEDNRSLHDLEYELIPDENQHAMGVETTVLHNPKAWHGDPMQCQTIALIVGHRFEISQYGKNFCKIHDMPQEAKDKFIPAVQRLLNKIDPADMEWGMWLTF